MSARPKFEICAMRLLREGPLRATESPLRIGQYRSGRDSSHGEFVIKGNVLSKFRNIYFCFTN